MPSETVPGEFELKLKISINLVDNKIVIEGKKSHLPDGVCAIMAVDLIHYIAMMLSKHFPNRYPHPTESVQMMVQFIREHKPTTAQLSKSEEQDLRTFLIISTTEHGAAEYYMLPQPWGLEMWANIILVIEANDPCKDYRDFQRYFDVEMDIVSGEKMLDVDREPMKLLSKEMSDEEIEKLDRNFHY